MQDDPSSSKFVKSMGLKWCRSDMCKKNRLKIRDELSCFNVFQKGEDDHHEIYNHASFPDEHYWGGSDPQQHVMKRYGMAASRKDGMAACGKYPQNERADVERSGKKKFNKNKRRRFNKRCRKLEMQHAMQRAWMGND
jgi:hypothetical protein